MSEESLLTHAILGYLLDHPDARDTLDGITEWWLPDQSKGQHPAMVKVALDKLIGRDLILERKDNDECAYYTVNGRKLLEVSALLKAKDQQ